MRDEKVVAVALRRRESSKLYHLDVQPLSSPTAVPTRQQAMLSTTPVSFNIWHRRLAHVNEDTMQKLNSGDLVDGVRFNKRTNSGPCPGCQFGKNHRLSFPNAGRQRGTSIGALTHSDVCEPMAPFTRRRSVLRTLQR